MLTLFRPCFATLAQERSGLCVCQLQMDVAQAKCHECAIGGQPALFFKAFFSYYKRMECGPHKRLAQMPIKNFMTEFCFALIWKCSFRLMTWCAGQHARMLVPCLDAEACFRRLVCSGLSFAWLLFDVSRGCRKGKPGKDYRWSDTEPLDPMKLFPPGALDGIHVRRIPSMPSAWPACPLPGLHRAQRHLAGLDYFCFSYFFCINTLPLARMSSSFVVVVFLQKHTLTPYLGAQGKLHAAKCTLSSAMPWPLQCLSQVVPTVLYFGFLQ